MRRREREAGLPELEKILITAASRMGESKPSLRRRLPGGRGSRIVAIGLCAVAFGGTAMAATGVWNPLVGSSEHPAELSDTPVPAGLVAKLGVLRREQTPQDRSPEVEATLKVGHTGFKYKPNFAVRLGSVRYLRPGANHEPTILLSGVTTVRPEIEPKKERWIAEVEEVCVARPVPGTEEAAFICFDRSELMSGHAVMGVSNPADGFAVALGVVPDGVATVTAKFDAAPPVNVPVEDNYWELPLSGRQLVNQNRGTGYFPASDPLPGVRRTVWRDAEGNFIPRQDPYTPWWVTRGREEAKTGEPYR
ncbi:MAG TPA: hypothetical protein VFX45_00060 [Solirubrobacterales bacterium]|nr:hypothetical protein [Solirubrobacterales bacterium]